MPNLTSPDSLPYPLAGEPAAPIQENFEDLAVATQIALAKRQRYSYDWADDAARLAQTGMIEGSEGFVRANKTNWTYSGGSWRLSMAHAEFTATLNQTSAYAGVGVFALDAGPSTSTSMAVASTTSGRIDIVEPGLYAITATVVWASGLPSNGGTLDIATSAAATTAVIRARPSGYNDLLSAAVGNYRTTAVNSPVYINGNVVPNASAATRVRITRLG